MNQFNNNIFFQFIARPIWGIRSRIQPQREHDRDQGREEDAHSSSLQQELGILQFGNSGDRSSTAQLQDQNDLFAGDVEPEFTSLRFSSGQFVRMGNIVGD